MLLVQQQELKKVKNFFGCVFSVFHSHHRLQSAFSRKLKTRTFKILSAYAFCTPGRQNSYFLQPSHLFLVLFFYELPFHGQGTGSFMQSARCSSCCFPCCFINNPSKTRTILEFTYISFVFFSASVKLKKISTIQPVRHAKKLLFKMFGLIFLECTPPQHF